MKTKLVVDVLAIMMKTVSTFLSVQTGTHASSSVFYQTQTAPHPVLLLQLVTEPTTSAADFLHIFTDRLM